MVLLPGQRSDVVTRGGDEGLYVLKGTLNLLAPDAEGQRWFELAPKDGFYLPQGAPHQYQNLTDAPVEFLFGVAPRYHAEWHPLCCHRRACPGGPDWVAGTSPATTTIQGMSSPKLR
jgi:quercetin dioxygenase-like cupin family protein